MLLGFLLGLLVGGIGLMWQRLHNRTLLLKLISEINSNDSVSSLSLESQLSTAILNQKSYGQHLQSRIQLYQFMLASAPIAFLHVDDENRLVWCNHLAQKLFNISQSQYPEPRLLLELVRSYELDELIERVRHDRHPQDQAWIFYPLNTNPARVQKQQSYSLKGFGIPLFDNHVGIFIENRQDIALLKQQRDRWTSDVAHELKTPLTSIRLIAETLQPRVEPSLAKWAERLIKQSTRLSNLVQDLLDLSQLEGESWNHIPSGSSINLPQLIKAVWNSLEPISIKKQIRFQYSGPDELQIFCDESKIYRVLINLLDNSIKYSPISETIYVNVQTMVPEGLVQIEVIDAGPGFSEDDLPHIFERFYRADTSRSRMESDDPSMSIPTQNKYPAALCLSEHTMLDHPMQARINPNNTLSIEHPNQPLHTTAPGGTGLGLAIVQQIIEAHGGEIEADNRLAKTGAIIRIRLPTNHS
ncbi:MAG: ATP-binding protein [Cyanobacteria bacterium P01_F01_bin.150]